MTARVHTAALTACAVSFLRFVPGAAAEQAASIAPCQGVEAQLAAIEPTVKSGTAPRFRLTLRNDTGTPAKVLDIRQGRRPDLEDAYYRLEVLKDGAPIALPRVICDPGPLSEEDFFRLPAGAQERMTLTVPCVDLSALPPGAYSARLLLVRDPLARRDTRCLSTEAAFEVRKSNSLP